MKFLCDRCKTRYSIGDDRVRGKILKIRCKNCANVITVREGMTEAEDGAVSLDRRARPTTAAPATNTASAPAGSALASAFAAQMSKPPPALEEEWYVSVDGDQCGPFSLADAQRWIAGKTFDLELHCWSEGFDDWLPVDKVSHFRGLRKKPAPSAPPPLPRVSPRAAAPLQRQPIEDEPKPLFAATMASIEKSSGAPAPERGLGLRPIASVPTLKGPASPINGVTAKANGTGSAPVPKLNDSARHANVPAVAVKPPKTPATPVVPIKPASGPRAPTVPGVGSTMTPGAKALAAAFDTSSDAEANESMTSVDSPAFVDEVATTAEPIATKRAFDRVDAVQETATPRKPVPLSALLSSGAPEMPDGDDESLDIGEVSRVVKLADLAKMGAPARKVSRAPLRSTGSSSRLDPAALAAAGTPMDPALAALQQPMGDPNTGEILVAAPVVAQAHRRGLIMLIGVAAVLLIGVAIAVVLIVHGGDDSTGGGLGHAHEIDTSRPEEVVRAHMMPNEPGPGSGVAIQRPRHFLPNPNHPQLGSDDPTGDPKGTRLKAEEIEEMASKQSQGTQRCYMRAQRGAEGIEIADLKKLSVTLSIDKGGVVNDVQFSEHGADTLGTCLASQIKRWKFRESPGGTYRIVMAFAN